MSIKDWPAGVINKTAVTPSGSYQESSASGIWTMDRVAYWVKQGLWPVPGNAAPLSDANFKYVSMLLTGDGTNGAQNNTFIDSSTNNATITRYGSTTQGTFSPFGNLWSNYFDATASFSTPNQTGFNFSTGDFTIEAWVYTIGAATTYGRQVVGKSNGSSGWALLVNRLINGNYGIVATNAAGTALGLNTTSLLPLYQWAHIAWVRASGTAKLYLNGVEVASASDTSNDTNTNTLWIASQANNGANQNFPGYISNLRIVKGYALYTSNFTPSTTPLTSFPGTSLLTCQSSRFRDASINNFTVTPTGTPRVQRISPFNPAPSYTTGSAYFDGNGDRLTTASNSSLALDSNNFTIECWCNFISGTSNELRFIWNNYNSWTAQSIFFGKHTNVGGNVSVWVNNYSTGAPLLTDPTLPPNDQWVHYALVRNGSTWTLYRDGFSVATATYAGVASTNTISQIGGNNESTSYTMYGYISDFRLVNGTAVYTSNFTRPSAPLTAIANTKLLTCQSTQFVDASTNNLTITTTGNPSISTITPFNSASGYNSLGTTTGSGYFASGAYLTVPDSTALNLSGGAYTIEGWIWPTGNYSNYNTIIAKRILGGSSTAWEVYLRISTGVLSFYNGTNYESSVTPSPNQWNHFAAVYDGTNMNLYLNGTRVLQSAVTNTDRSTPIYIGTFPTYGEQYLGYMSNLRIVKGTALYSGTTLTVPTSPLTAISGTSLLLNFSNAGIPDVSMQNVFETVNGTQVSTSVKKYGTGSINFGNSNGYLSLGTELSIVGDYTIEFWAYLTGISGNGYSIGFGATSVNSQLPTFQSNGVVGYYNNGATFSSGTGKYSLNTWFHCAVVRSSNTVKIYIDGIDVGTSTTDTNILYIKNISGYNGGAGGYNILGYFDDVRVSSVSRYNANFTPPTKALSTQ